MDHTYDVFVSYRWVEPDQTWVRERLAPALEAAGLKVCLDVNDFTPGRDLMLEMERAGTTSSRALCIITPSYFDGNRMVGFEALMARRRDPSGAESKLIPFVLQKTDMPEWVRGLVPIDWTQERNRPREWKKLLKVLGSINPEALPPGETNSADTAKPELKPAAAVSVRPVLPTSPERKKLRFADEIRSDPVAVKFAVSTSYKESIPYDIAWPETTLQHRECLKQLLAEAEDYHSSKSRFYRVDPKTVTAFVESAQLALACVEPIITQAAKRIPRLLEGMKGYWGFLDSPQEHALANYLTWANLQVLQNLLTPLKYRVLYDTFSPKQYDSWFSNRFPKQPIKDAFGIEEPVYTAHCISVENYRANAYYWGPSSIVKDAYKMSLRHKPLTNPWYARYLIPQVELDLAIRNSDELVVYKEQAKLSKVLDENGAEIDPY